MTQLPKEINQRPFLKWPGGKYRLIERIRTALGPGKRLIEPFVGSAAVFLNTHYEEAILADSNADLINLYRIVEQQGEAFIHSLEPLFEPDTNNAESYYQYRDQFNDSEDTSQRAALFVYLNRHCYNGLCRYNNSGRFNSPFGRYKQPQIPVAGLQAFQQKIATATLLQASFTESLKQARAGDVVYCDPPYVALSKTANFTRYSHNDFTMDEQIELANLARQLSKDGVRVVISNHDTVEMRELYAGAEIQAFDVPRFISQDIKNRTKAAEILAVFKAQ